MFDSLEEFLAGAGTVRSLPTPSDDEEVVSSPAMPTSLQLENMFPVPRTLTSSDAQRRYRLCSTSDGGPLHLNEKEVPVVLAATMRAAPGAGTAPDVVIKASFLHDMPEAVRMAHNALCETDVLLKQRGSVGDVTIRALSSAANIVSKDVYCPSPPLGFRDEVARFLGAHTPRSDTSDATEDDTVVHVSNDNAGVVYLEYEHIVVAMRLLETLDTLGAPNTYPGGKTRWRADYRGVLKRIIESEAAFDAPLSFALQASCSDAPESSSSALHALAQQGSLQRRGSGHSLGLPLLLPDSRWPLPRRRLLLRHCPLSFDERRYAQDALLGHALHRHGIESVHGRPRASTLAPRRRVFGWSGRTWPRPSSRCLRRNARFASCTTTRIRPTVA